MNGNPGYSFHGRADGTVALDHHGEAGFSRVIFDLAAARDLLMALERAIREAETARPPS